MYNICNCLSVSRRSRTTAIYAIVNVSQLVRNTIGLQKRFKFHFEDYFYFGTHDIASCSCTTVCTDYNAFIELDGHD